MPSSLAASPAASAAAAVASKRSFAAIKRPAAASTRRPRSATATASATPSSTDATPAMAQPAITLCYFEVYAKGLQCAMVAAHSGLEWRAKSADFNFKAVKDTAAPFGQMPLLYIDGADSPIGQSTAIASTIGRMSNTDGADDIKDFAMSSMLMAEAEDLYAAMVKASPTAFVALGTGTKTAENHALLWAEVMPHHMGCLEKLLVGDTDKFTTTGLVSGELFLFGIIYQIVLCSDAIFDDAPKLKAWYNRILSHAKTQDVLAGTSPMGKMGQYFINP